MTLTRVAVLTPPGTGAIATIAVAGPKAWEVVRTQFRPANGKPLPGTPAPLRFWFGTLGEGAGDEVVVALTALEPVPWVEVHCHGGRRVVRWLIGQLVEAGCKESTWPQLEELRGGRHATFDHRAMEPLTRATTLRTASVLLDQYHGAFARAVGEAVVDPTHLAEWGRYASVGRHLVAPWRVVIAGAPNAGKSSLVNAIAGYQRSVVAPIPGTTRDVVTTLVALEGWPVELIDTAGLRNTADPLEAEGVVRARQALASSDLVVWVFDAAEPNPVRPDPPALVVANKVDLLPAWASEGDVISVSAFTGAGLPDLIAAIVARLVTVAPPSGAAVPFTPSLADAVDRAVQLHSGGNVVAAREALATCLPGATDGV